MLPRILPCVVGWAKAHHLNNLDFEEPGVTLWSFKRTWEKHTLRWFAVTVSDSFSSNATHKLSLLVSFMAAVGGLASLVALFGGLHVLADT